MLGPLEVHGPGGAVEVAGATRRAVLTALALNAGRPVTLPELTVRVWADEPPARAAGCLRSTAADLQRLLPGAVGVVGSCFRLDLPPTAVDLYAARALAAAGRDAFAVGRYAAAAELFDRAAARWRGPALAGIRYGARWPEAPELAEERQTLLEDRLHAALAAGRHREVAAALPDLICAEPLRERRYGLLMLALAADGRAGQAEIVYREACAVLADECGLRPGRALRAVRAAIRAPGRAAGPAAGLVPGPAGRRSA